MINIILVIGFVICLIASTIYCFVMFYNADERCIEDEPAMLLLWLGLLVLSFFWFLTVPATVVMFVKESV